MMLYFKIPISRAGRETSTVLLKSMILYPFFPNICIKGLGLSYIINKTLYFPPSVLLPSLTGSVSNTYFFSFTTKMIIFQYLLIYLLVYWLYLIIQFWYYSIFWIFSRAPARKSITFFRYLGKKSKTKRSMFIMVSYIQILDLFLMLRFDFVYNLAFQRHDMTWHDAVSGIETAP